MAHAVGELVTRRLCPCNVSPHLPRIPVFHLLLDIDHLLGMIVIDASGQCTQPYNGAAPTDIIV
jgi:hypothetical protein